METLFLALLLSQSPSADVSQPNTLHSSPIYRTMGEASVLKKKSKITPLHSDLIKKEDKETEGKIKDAQVVATSD